MLCDSLRVSFRAPQHRAMSDFPELDLQACSQRELLALCQAARLRLFRGYRMRAGNSTDGFSSEERFLLVYNTICKDKTYVVVHLEEEIYRMLLKKINAMSQDRVDFHRMCDDVRAELDWIDPAPPFDPDER